MNSYLTERENADQHGREENDRYSFVVIDALADVGQRENAKEIDLPALLKARMGEESEWGKEREKALQNSPSPVARLRRRLFLIVAAGRAASHCGLSGVRAGHRGTHSRADLLRLRARGQSTQGAIRRRYWQCWPAVSHYDLRTSSSWTKCTMERTREVHTFAVLAPC